LQKRLLDHIIVLNVRHLQRLMNEYISYYHEDRTHLALEKETPAGRVTAKNRVQAVELSSCRGSAVCTIVTTSLPKSSLCNFRQS
jgi:hypothetical protein